MVKEANKSTLIGIRCSPKKIYYSIIKFDGDHFTLSNQVLIIPKSFDIPNKLKYVRKTFLDIIREYDVRKAGIRITEYNVQSPDLFRIMLEAVIQELIASSNISTYFTGVKNSIVSKLGMPNDGYISSIIEGSEVYQGINDWGTFSLEHRESILVGFAAQNI
jgi:hypothetical protein